jgi:hypothetical protein
VTVRADEDVRRLEVPVHQSALVQVRHRACDLRHGLRDPDGVRALASRPRSEVFTLDVLQCEVRQTVFLPGFDHGDDPRVMDRRHRPRLASEASATLGAGEGSLGQDLEGDQAVEPLLTGEVHDAHAAATELADELVTRESTRFRRARFLPAHGSLLVLGIQARGF